MSLPRIGVLGGMGPAATVTLMQRIIAAVPARDDADHLPLLVDQNPQVPSRIARLIDGKGDDPAPVLRAMAQRLEQGGARALVMPCNTAHFYADAIREAVNIPLIDMIALTVEKAVQSVGKGGKVGVLASPAVESLALYARPLREHGLTAVYPTDTNALLEVIQSVKAHGPTLSSRTAFQELSSALLQAGAKTQLIACTEFSLIADAISADATGFDALDCLVEGTFEFAFRGDANEALVNHQ
jgi:aspartate racemase